MIFDLIKLGGSVLTDGGERLTPRRDVLRRIAREIVESLPEERWQTGAGLVIVHGAGSLRRPWAQDHELGPGSDVPDRRPPNAGAGRAPEPSSPALRVRVVAVQEEIRHLHLALLQSLVEAGVPAVSLPGAGFLRISDGRLERPDLTEMLRAAAQGFVPVSCGDVVFDPKQGPRVISGDRLMVEICRQTEPGRATFVTDVEGVFDRDPSCPEASLLTRLEVDEGRLGPWPCAAPDSSPESASVRFDGTGGMYGKLDALTRIASPNRQTFVVSGLVPGRLGSYLRGEGVRGTSVVSK